MSRSPFLRKFGHDRRAGVMPVFALAAIPLIGVVGAAVDYSRANAARTAIQAAIDATALALSKDAPSLSAAQLQTRADAYFNGVFTRKSLSTPTITATYTSEGSGSQIVVTASGKVGTTFLGIFGMGDIDIGSSSTVKWGQSRLRVALALDNTGSMDVAGKMTALKTATKNLLAQLKAAATSNGDVYVSIIPFSRDVNAKDIGGHTSSWIRWVNTAGNADAWDDRNGTCSKSKYKTKSSCTSHGGSWTAANHNTWNGCIMDRDQNYDISNAAPTSSNPATLFPADQYASCPAAMMGMSYDWTALNAKVDAMTPSGNTNQAIGLVWAWQSLTEQPFTVPPEDPNYKYQKVIILLSDGLNTQNRWTTNAAAIDNREKLLCAALKAAGITLYTIQVNTDGDPTSTLLQQCASTADKFFLLTSANQIVTTFSAIGTALSQLRLAK